MIPPDCHIPAKFWTRGYSYEKNRRRAPSYQGLQSGGELRERAHTKMTGLGGDTCGGQGGGETKCSKKAEKDEETGQFKQVVRAGLTEEVT